MERLTQEATTLLRSLDVIVAVSDLGCRRLPVQIMHMEGERVETNDDYGTHVSFEK